MLCHGQNLRECFLAGVADELIVGHTNLPQPLNGYGWILDLQLEQFQLSQLSASSHDGIVPDDLEVFFTGNETNVSFV
jgi:hypothetical protein